MNNENLKYTGDDKTPVSGEKLDNCDADNSVDTSDDKIEVCTDFIVTTEGKTIFY